MHSGYFGKLSSIEIWNKREGNFAACEMSLKQVMHHAPLTRILFKNVDTLTDDLVASTLDLNRGLRVLENAVFDHCAAITSRYIHIHAYTSYFLVGRGDTYYCR